MPGWRTGQPTGAPREMGCCVSASENASAAPAEPAVRVFWVPNGAAGVSQGPSRDDVRSAVWRLPIETYATRTEVAAWSIPVLCGELREAKARAPRSLSGRESTDQPPLERWELVDAVVAARGGEEGLACAVCVEDFVSGDTVRVLRCGHRFHLECCDRWLLGCEHEVQCPMCKADVL